MGRFNRKRKFVNRAVASPMAPAIYSISRNLEMPRGRQFSLLVNGRVVVADTTRAACRTAHNELNPRL